MTNSDSPAATEVLQRVAHWLRQARSAVVFTGAGISTESGIPDFRSPGGVWSRYRTVYYDEFMNSAEARHEYWRQKCEAHREFADALPNVGHQALARWEALGWVRGVITQNIDELHQLAGSQQVWELHGTARKAGCLDCHARYDVAAFVERFLATQQTPDCPACGGRLKHATISFGQPLQPVVLQEAFQASRQADLFLAIGSSLVVEPAASMPVRAKQSGGRLVIINATETPLDSIADVVIHARIGETLAAIDHEANATLHRSDSGLGGQAS
jgi:NAD-dependent deacetylase